MKFKLQACSGRWGPTSHSPFACHYLVSSKDGCHQPPTPPHLKLLTTLGINFITMHQEQLFNLGASTTQSSQQSSWQVPDNQLLGPNFDHLPASTFGATPLLGNLLTTRPGQVYKFLSKEASIRTASRGKDMLLGRVEGECFSDAEAVILTVTSKSRCSPFL